MKFNATDGTNQILYEESAWTGKKSLYINGQACEKINKNEFLFKTAEGQSVYFKTVGNIISGLNIVTPTKTVEVIKKLNILEWIFCILPLILVFFGGAIGGALGGAAFVTNVILIRKFSNIGLKFLACLGTGAAAAIIWLIIGALIYGA